MILGIFERLGVTEADGFEHLHGLVEASKQAFMVRDREITDPARMRNSPERFLTPDTLDGAAAAIDPASALPWPQPPSAGDTVWMGAIDGKGRAVSFIQSVYWEFGSGVVLEGTGIQWQNRGSSFKLDAGALNVLERGRKPFHTLNPALFLFEDGRAMPYGTMGGGGPAPDPGRGAHPLRLLRPEPPERGQRPALASRPDLGGGKARLSSSNPASIPEWSPRSGSPGTRWRPSVHSTSGWAMPAHSCTIRAA